MTAAVARITTALAQIDAANKALDAISESYLYSDKSCGEAEVLYARRWKAAWESDAAYAALGVAIAKSPKQMRKAIALGLEGRAGPQRELELAKSLASRVFCPVCSSEELDILSCDIPLGGDEFDCRGCICDCQDCRELVRVPPEMVHRDWPAQ